MTLEHGIVRDLLPLYADGVCGEESKKAVEEHLAGCDSCRAEYERLKNSGTFGETPGPGEEKRAAALKKVRRTLNWKRVAAVCLAVVVTLGVLTGAGMWMNSATVRVPAETVRSVRYLDLRKPGDLEAYNQEIQSVLAENGDASNYRPWAHARGDADTGLDFVLEGKYANYGIGETALRIGDKYVLLCFVRVTRWEDLFPGHTMVNCTLAFMSSGWEDWVKWAIQSQYDSLEPDETGEPRFVKGTQPPQPVDENCVFDEAYFLPDSQLARLYVGPGNLDPQRLQELLDEHVASGDAVLIWERGQ